MAWGRSGAKNILASGAQPHAGIRFSVGVFSHTLARLNSAGGGSLPFEGGHFDAGCRNSVWVSPHPACRFAARHATLLIMKMLAVVPARLASTRLPRKVLRPIAGEPMLARVYAAVRAAGIEVVVATDSDEILALCRERGLAARMTSSRHRSGTERVHEIAQTMAASIYLNVQGDEPLARPEHIAQLSELMLRRTEAPVGTLKTPCPECDLANPNAVKVVTDAEGRALYFSRATIPFDRDGVRPAYFKHLGFYAYRKAALERFCSLPESALERSERLEQLRFLENGIPIYVAETPYDTIGVDTEEDLRRAEQALLRQART